VPSVKILKLLTGASLAKGTPAVLDDASALYKLENVNLSDGV